MMSDLENFHSRNMWYPYTLIYAYMHKKVYYKCLRPNLNFILSLKKAPRQTAKSNSPSTARSHGYQNDS